MDVREFERGVAELLAEFQGVKILRKQLDYLDSQISANEQQLNDSYINIPFTKYSFIDKLGIVRHHIPVLLRQNKHLVLTYNAKVNKYQQTSIKMLKHLQVLINDCNNSPSDLLQEKNKLIEKYFKDYL